MAESPDDAGSESNPHSDLPDYAISAEKVDCKVSIEFNGVAIAESDNALLYRESRLSPVYYFPREDVRMDLLRRTRHRSHCPFKGNASYWSVNVGDKEVENAVWSYENPLNEAVPIKGYLAFWLEKLGATYQEDGDFSAQHTEMDSHGSAYVDWLLREGWNTENPLELTERLAKMLVASGTPVARLSVFLRTLHPLLIGSAYVWRSDKEQMNSFVLTHETLSNPTFLDSPLVSIFNGAGGIRRRLEGEDPLLDFGILKQLHGEGITDYAAMPMTFSDGQINVLTMASDQAGGFSIGDLGRVHEILPVLSRYYEVHAARGMADSLLQTYLGSNTGRKVMKGQIKRGDSENLHAVIWFCDLRQSTALAESMPIDDYLAVLNRFFECMVRPIVGHGGEVLSFIGDAVLAVFPLVEADSKRQRACEDALAAAVEAEERVDAFNVERAAEKLEPLNYGIGLHVGHLAYGNIGVPERLQFTVIGSAANEAARIQDLTKEQDRKVLASSIFADYCPAPLEPIGEFELRGVSQKQTIFVPQDLPGF
jgi:class 3 adenylate cyclase/uncharacterized protein (DUF427 family)